MPWAISQSLLLSSALYKEIYIFNKTSTLKGDINTEGKTVSVIASVEFLSPFNIFAKKFTEITKYNVKNPEKAS